MSAVDQTSGGKTSAALTEMQNSMGGGMVVQNEEERAFEFLQRKAKMYASSEMVPKDTYQGKIANCIIAMEMASRLGIPVLAVMQSLYVIHGNPSWKAEFVISRINQSGKFKGPLKYKLEGEGTKRKCTAYAVDKSDGLLVEMVLDWGVVEAEGWNKKPGSKWLTMPDQMFRYRSATWFARAYCPEVLFGIAVEGEIIDGMYEVVEAEEVETEKTPPPAKSLATETVSTVTETQPEELTPGQKRSRTARLKREARAKAEKEKADEDAAQAERDAQDAASDPEPIPEPIPEQTPEPIPAPEPKKEPVISSAKVEFLVGVLVEAGLDDDEFNAEEKSMCQKLAGVDGFQDFPASKYDALLKELDERTEFWKAGAK
jgi:hypothetical protein